MKVPLKLKHFGYVFQVNFPFAKRIPPIQLNGQFLRKFLTFLPLLPHAAQNRGGSCLLCLNCSYGPAIWSAAKRHVDHCILYK